MQVRYYLDPETGEPHIYDHGVTEEEVEYVLRHSGEDLPGTVRGKRWASPQGEDTCV
jgi:hypothetical protein